MERPLDSPLHILYTGGLRGDLKRLPSLFTFLRERARTGDGARLLLLDTGGRCAPEVWHCAATAGRSMLIALDGMGFHAALEDGLSAESRERLRENWLGLALVSAAKPFVQDGIAVCDTSSRLPEGAALGIALAPAANTHLEGRWLHLAAVEGAVLGEASLTFAAGVPALATCALYPLPSAVLPDPTLAGTITFIEGEARRYASR